MNRKIKYTVLIMLMLMFWRPFVPQAKAVLGVGDIVSDPAEDVEGGIDDVEGAVDDLTTGEDAVSNTAGWVTTVSNIAVTALTEAGVVTNKIAALTVVQAATALFIGSTSNGGGGAIHDFNNYLYVAPQQVAMAQMNTFFTTVSQGRLSSLNYEGVGPNYDAYLVGQAKQSINGQTFQTNLQNQVTDPSQLFSGGNMKGIMSYMQCANNVACYTLTATAQYNQNFAKAQNIAKSENVNGFAPKKTNGVITGPAAIIGSALTQVDQLGTQLVMNAKSDGTEAGDTAAIGQIWAGAALSATARMTNYGISDPAQQAAIANKNSQFPFSLSYNSNSGVGLSAGGVTISATGNGNPVAPVAAR